MEKQIGFLVIDPGQGNDNATLQVGASVHTGRVAREKKFKVRAAGVPDREVTATQEAKIEFVEVSGISVGKEGGNVTLTGKSNSSKLTIETGSGAIEVNAPATYNRGGIQVASGEAIPGDPGATEEFDFSVEFSVPANPDDIEASKQVVVTANGGQQAIAVISQAAGDPVLTVEPTSIAINANGDAVSVAITSNTNWEVVE